MAEDEGSKEPSAPREDFSLYVQDDDLKQTVAWCIRDYKELGAFTEVQKREIGARFELSAELVDELSLLVGNSLDVESIVSLLRVTRRKAVERAGLRLEEAARLARRLRADHAALSEQMKPIDALFDESGRADPLIAALKADLDGIKPLLAGLERRTDEIKSIPNGAAVILPDDKRVARDMRRTHVVRSCCYVWEDAGRTVSYTTVSHKPGEPQRRGELIELINMVVCFVTDPPSALSGETIRRDIDGFRKLSKDALD